MTELKKYSNLSFADINRSQSGKEKLNLLRPKRGKENYIKPKHVQGPKNLCVTKIDMENGYLRESRGSLHHNPSIMTMAQQNRPYVSHKGMDKSYPYEYPLNNI